jgi:hypothetical protein
MKNWHPAVSQDRKKLEAIGVRLEAQKKSAAVSRASSFEPPASSRLHVSL